MNLIPFLIRVVLGVGRLGTHHSGMAHSPDYWVFILMAG